MCPVLHSTPMPIIPTSSLTTSMRVTLPTPPRRRCWVSKSTTPTRSSFTYPRLRRANSWPTQYPASRILTLAPTRPLPLSLPSTFRLTPCILPPRASTVLPITTFHHHSHHCGQQLPFIAAIVTATTTTFASDACPHSSLFVSFIVLIHGLALVVL